MSRIMGTLMPLGQKNGRDVIAAIPDIKNGRPGWEDRFAIVAVDVSCGEAVAALTGQLTGGEWDEGYYFNGTPDQIDEMIQQATRKAIRLAGYANQP